MKRRLALILALLLMSSAALTGCSDSNKQNENTDDSNPGGTVQTGENADAQADEEDYDPHIEQTDYNGREFIILDRADDDSGWWCSIDVYSEEMTGEVINDAVFDRNKAVEDYFNIGINHYSDSNFKTVLKNSAAANDHICDLGMLSLSGAMTCSQENLLFDLHLFDVINFDAPYYTKSVFNDTSVLHRNYFAVGDMTLIANDGTWALMFNKQVREDLGVEDLYELARNNEWTIDKYYSIIKDIGYDDGNGKVDDNDFYGLITSNDSYQGMLYALDYRVVDKDENDGLVYRGFTERLTTAVEKLVQIMSDQSITYNYNKYITWYDAQLMFEAGHSLFYGEVLQCVTRLRNMDVDFGLIPYPKLDDIQECYKTCIHSGASDCLTIPSMVEDPEMSAKVFEYLSYQSMNYLKPAYYGKALTYKAMRDEESIEMLDYVLEGRVVDIGYIADIGTVYSSLLSQLSSGKTELSSFFQKKLKPASKELQKVMDAYNAMTSQY